MILYAKDSCAAYRAVFVAGRLLVLGLQHDALDVRKLASDPFDGARP
jgi:hypothetical protein